MAEGQKGRNCRMCKLEWKGKGGEGRMIDLTMYKGKKRRKAAKEKIISIQSDEKEGKEEKKKGKGE